MTAKRNVAVGWLRGKCAVTVIPRHVIHIPALRSDAPVPAKKGLAHRAGLDRSYVGRIERGEHNLTFVALVKLCWAMKCDVAALTHGLPTGSPSGQLEHRENIWHTLAMASLLNMFPTPDDLLALEPEELGGVLMELIPSISQFAGFLLDSLHQQVYRPDGTGYSRNHEGDVLLAIAEAVEWLRYNGLIVRNPSQPAEWFLGSGLI